jgi:hypothetical protein
MAESSIFPEKHVTPPVVYRRVSGIAIASLTVALLFGLCLLVGAIMGFRDHSPLLLPVGLQVLPIVSALLALAALYLIRRSEGTLAGARMAAWGWWLAVVFGLGYWAYYGATYFAVVQQAETFTRAWFEKMAQRDFAAALLDTQEPAERLKLNPKDLNQINLRFVRMAQAMNKEGVPVPASDVLRNTDLGRLLNQGGQDSRVSPLGVYDWSFKDGTYTVRRMYQITTPEGEWRARVTVRGMESRSNEYPGRQWFVTPGETSFNIDGGLGGKLSSRGQQVAELAQDAYGFLQNWGAKLFDHKLADAYLDTREPGERAALRARLEAGAVLSALAAAPASVVPLPGAVLLQQALPLDPELGRELYLKGYFDDFIRRSLIHTQDLYIPDEALQTLAVPGINRLLGSREAGPACVGIKPGAVSSYKPWVYDEQSGRLQLCHELKVGFPPQDSNMSPYMVLAVVTLKTDSALPGSEHKPNWQILRVDLLGAGEVGRGPSGGRPGRRSAVPPLTAPGR